MRSGLRLLQQAALLMICFIIWLSALSALPANAATADELKTLLQKSLTVYEIDQELSRLESEEQTLLQKINQTEQDIQVQQERSAETKRHAAKVLRAYYMGDRDSLWMLLFSIQSFKDALITFEYLQMIVRNDHDILQKHLQNQEELKQLESSLLASKNNLEQAKARYLAEREQRLQLQKQLDEELSKQSVAASASILQQMTQLTFQWQDKGVPLFRTYFQALAQAMKQLPEILSSPTGTDGKNNHLILNGLQQSTFQLTDQDLNTFLRSKNDIFRNLTFQFSTNAVIAKGRQDDVDVTIKGHYELAAKGDEKPVTYIRFRMDELQFNGFDLPSSTIESMEKEFDLNIYPQMMITFLQVQVTGIQVEEGKLNIFFRLSL